MPNQQAHSSLGRWKRQGGGIEGGGNVAKTPANWISKKKKAGDKRTGSAGYGMPGKKTDIAYGSLKKTFGWVGKSYNLESIEMGGLVDREGVVGLSCQNRAQKP